MFHHAAHAQHSAAQRTIVTAQEKVYHGICALHALQMGAQLHVHLLRHLGNGHGS
ncbi:MAG: hypothetical protein IPI55_05615 [Flavobacteriales bacterium]|nr:hypothetical protein [Flavobacteriales bacterium]